MSFRLVVTTLLALALCQAPFAPHAVAQLLAEFPDEMAETVAEAADGCRKDGGTADVAKVLQSDDLNGDGRPDWVADYKKLACKNGSNPACGPHGCLLQLYYSSGDDWDKVFEDFVKGYKFSTSGTTRMIHVTTSGMPCNKPDDETCNYTYRLDDEVVTPVR